MINVAPSRHDQLEPDRLLPDQRARDQRGLAAGVELVILVPALMIMVAMIVIGGRIWFTRSAVTEAAYSGARAASMERTSEQALRLGRTATVEQLAMDGVRCRNRSIGLDVADFDRPIGTSGAVINTVSCRVRLADLSLPGVPGSVQVHGRGVAVIDSYRQR